MRFPKLLAKAVLLGDKVCFSIAPTDLEDSEIVEYNKWKAKLKINVLTRRRLLKLLEKRLYRSELEALFKRNLQLGYAQVAIWGSNEKIAS